MSAYLGRFAPSPTGPLHFGSLVAALASFCDAKANGGQWLLRMEDLDKPRELKGAVQQMMHVLEAFGFEWDGEIVYQSEQLEHYQTALNQLIENNLIYPCACSRKEIADSSPLRGIEGAVYPKTCLNKLIKNQTRSALRIKTPNEVIAFNDAIHGEITQNLGAEIGDFVLLRADKIFSYQLAVVVDDAAQGITHIVRGADLLQSTPRQIYLQRQLGFNQPNYAHIPIVCNAQGEKLSKQTLAAEIKAEYANALLFEALVFLGQSPPDLLKSAEVKTIMAWAIANWNISALKQHHLS